MDALGNFLSSGEARVALSYNLVRLLLFSRPSDETSRVHPMTRRAYFHLEPIVNYWCLATKRCFGFRIVLLSWVNTCDAFSSLRFSIYRRRELRLV